MYSKCDIFESSEFQIGNKAKIVLQQKRLNGAYKLDIRIWMKHSQTDDYFPMKHGVCLLNSVVRDQLLPEINKYLEKYD